MLKYMLYLSTFIRENIKSDYKNYKDLYKYCQSYLVVLITAFGTSLYNLPTVLC